ncbi:restriction endonuclease subunit S [Aeromonas veronii]|uniref:restriction endonuclease subunit S n=1 Tax=Aeromonas veronii TaxID=654 RepID=UPI00191F9611|nr:restriction endonuclease subunit S [Aeromonas veronii]MBL0442888.1 restriction endonuclease subunit S [Aeromonas veronii]
MAEQMMQEAAGKTIPAGYKQTEVGVIPEDWEVNPLGDLCSLKSGLGITSKDIDDSSAYRCFGGNGLRGYTQKYTHDGNYVLIGRQGALCGNIQYVSGRFFASEHALVATLSKFSNAMWLAVYLERMNLNQYSESSAQPGLSAEKLRILKLITPTNEEQTAIANVLSDSDALIDALEQLIAKKQAIKSGTMQQLLTGRTRLPAFALRPDGTPKGYKPSEVGDIPEDWEVAPIGSVLSITTGARNTQDKVDDGRYPFFVRSQTVERINTYSFDGEAVLTAGDGVGTGKIFHYVNGKFDFHQRVYLMYNFGERVSGYFFYLFFSNNFFERIMSMTAKSSVDSVRREMIADMKMVLPSKVEQTAIATILSDMDNELQALTQKLEKVRALKQGMMQQLLTGKIRLPLAVGA